MAVSPLNRFIVEFPRTKKESGIIRALRVLVKQQLNILLHEEYTICQHGTSTYPVFLKRQKDNPSYIMKRFRARTAHFPTIQ